MQAQNDWADTSSAQAEPDKDHQPTGRYAGFYQRAMRKKKEAQEALFENDRKVIDLDQEL